MKLGRQALWICLPGCALVLMLQTQSVSAFETNNSALINCFKHLPLPLDERADQEGRRRFSAAIYNPFNDNSERFDLLHYDKETIVIDKPGVKRPVANVGERAVFSVIRPEATYSCLKGELNKLKIASGKSKKFARESFLLDGIRATKVAVRFSYGAGKLAVISNVANTDPANKITCFEDEGSPGKEFLANAIVDSLRLRARVLGYCSKAENSSDRDYKDICRSDYLNSRAKSSIRESENYNISEIKTYCLDSKAIPFKKLITDEVYKYFERSETSYPATSRRYQEKVHHSKSGASLVN